MEILVNATTCVESSSTTTSSGILNLNETESGNVVVAAISTIPADDTTRTIASAAAADHQTSYPSTAEVTSDKDGDGANSGGTEKSASGIALVVAKQQQRKKHHRRGKKSRRWKPYSKLSWDEKRALEDRESRRAQRVRDERFAHGQPVAPYNTTQFLMEDHNVQEPDLEGSHYHQGQRRQHRDSGDASTGVGGDSDEYYYSSPEDEDEFLQREFCEVYDNINAERLASMSKLQLIQEYMQLEERVDKLENKLQRGGSGGGGSATKPSTVATTNWDRDAETNEKVRIFQQEIRKLAEENERLRQENDELAAAKQARLAAASAKQAESQDENAVEAVGDDGDHHPCPPASNIAD